jgi:hypothetical protein
MQQAFSKVKERSDRIGEGSGNVSPAACHTDATFVSSVS